MKRRIIIVAIGLILLGISVSSLVVAAKAYDNGNYSWPYPPPESTPLANNIPQGQKQTISTLSAYPAPNNDLDSVIVTPLPLSNHLLLIDYPYKIFLPIIMKPYDRVAAVTHADNFAHGRSDEFPNNYGTGCDCVDCTNFVSQSLYKGGIGLKTGNWDENSVYEWWYKANYIGPIFIGYTNSKTWSATDWFNTYLYQYTNQFELRSWPTQLESGDFFILDLQGSTPGSPPDGIPDHARFVVGYGNSSEDPADYTCQSDPIPTSTYGLLVDQHCVDRKHVAWDYRLSNFGVWPFHVK
jgi:hypothetical protein